MLETQLRSGDSAATRHFGFLLVGNFALVPFASAIETLRMANQVAGKTVYSWDTLSIDGKPVTARCGIEVSVTAAVPNKRDYAVLFVCGGTSIGSTWSARLAKWLHLVGARCSAMGALSTGAYLLAKAGLLDGYRATVHWEKLGVMREDFPQVYLTDSIYEIDRDRFTCAGGTASIDLMLYLIAAECGSQLAATISDNLLHDRVRCASERQRIPLMHQIANNQPKIREAAALMAANIEEPLSIDDLAGFARITRRQLERLFRAHLQCSPRQFYKRLRLDHARQLLVQTDKSIMEISLLCGFSTTAHFSSSYRSMFGVTPTEGRSNPTMWDSEKR
jgi:transcriptional regulator GlxA family with amidase domain